MVKLIASTAIKMGGLNFANLMKADDSRFNETMIRLDFDSGLRHRFGGSFSANAATRSINGTATSWKHSNYKTGQVFFEITAASLSASAVLAAAKTKKTSDDRGIIEKMFSKADLIVGSNAADVLIGYKGNDTIQGRGGLDTIDGAEGRDRVDFGIKAVELTLNKSNWVYSVVDGVGEDKIKNVEDISGSSKSDKLGGDAFGNILLGRDGDDTIGGGSGNDTIDGGSGNDSLAGGAHNDSILGGAGNDSINGGSGHDFANGGGGSDTIVGGPNNDKLLGANGSDVVSGGTGSDTIDGGKGSDAITGGTGKDSLTGGADADVFYFVAITDSTTTPAGRDIITDFKHLTDKINLSAIDAMATATVGIDEAFILDGKRGANAVLAEGHISWYTVNATGTANDRTFIRINNDADAAIESTIELKGLINLGGADFIL
jgi:Ca2+-binding RTX toxin-like protein